MIKCGGCVKTLTQPPYSFSYLNRSLIGDIPKIRKFKATNSLRVGCLFVSLSIPPKNGLTAKTGVIKNKNTW